MIDETKTIRVGSVTLTDYQTIVAFEKGDLRVDIPMQEWRQMWRRLTTFQGVFGSNTMTITDSYRFTALEIQVFYSTNHRNGDLSLKMDILPVKQDESIQKINSRYGDQG